ncbi:MAG: Uncharacterized protein G01um10145_687 [Microgenomates group bacterium Gr01-1014_5]|nr:MAG: Uncharacterized protein G01um10145_687 [Microgenomates group bacterium Gr01-1014_5]
MVGKYTLRLLRYKYFLVLAAASILTTVAVWLPFLLRLDSFWGISLPKDGMATIVANYDGLFYIVAAKSWYDPAAITGQYPFQLEPIYYSAHYPLYPLLIRGVATVFPFLGYPYAMIITTLVSGILAVIMFYLLLLELGLKKQALWLALLFTFFPARWLVVRSIGSPEPLFIFTILASIYFFLKEKWWYAAFFGALAQLTKPPGILLFIGYIIALIAPYWQKLAHTDAQDWLRKLPWKAWPLLLIPLTLLSIYAFYGLRYGDFFAYFNSGDNIHLTFPPFQAFNPGQAWVGTFWLEEIVWLYLFGALGVLYLIKQKNVVLASFASVFFITLMFVSHRDISRYSLPLVPLLYIAFSKVLDFKEFKWVVLVLLIPIYLFSIVFIANNVTPVGDWKPLL